MNYFRNIIFLIVVLNFSLFTFASEKNPIGAIRWDKACHVIDDDALTSTLLMYSNKWKIDYFAYEDEACSKAYLNYQVIHKAKTMKNDVDLTVTEVSYTPLSDEVARALNLINYCGFTNWAKNTKTIVTGLLCDDFQVPHLGKIIYSIFDLENINDNEKKLGVYLGIPTPDFDGLTPQKRHNTLDPLPYIKNTAL